MNKELKQVKSRSFISAVSLVGQGTYAAVLGFIAFFVLTLKSGAYLLGIYNTVLAMLAFFNYFTNLGLAAAIMQKREVEEVDLNSAFYIQFFLTVVAVIIGFILTPHLFDVYKDLPHSAVYLYWAVLVSFFFLSLKSIPSILMEKNIEIYKVVSVQAIENTLFYGIVIVLVMAGYEIFALVAAVLVRAIIGLILIYILRPWRPRLMFSWKAAKALLKYGIPFQSNSFLALVKDDLLIIYLGSAIGLANLGVVTFAKKYAEFSIRLVMDNINRVAFPLFARFQDDKTLLKKSLQKVLFYESVFIFPIIIGAIFIFDSVLKIVPGYFEKWHMALPLFYFFSLSALLVSLSTPFINLFNAIGRVKLSVYFMVLWTGLLWGLIFMLMRLFGILGISIAFFVMSLTFILVYMVAKKFVNFTLWEFISESAIASIVMAIYLVIIRFLTLTIIYNPPLHVILSITGGALLYFYGIERLKGQRFFAELSELFKLKI